MLNRRLRIRLRLVGLLTPLGGLSGGRVIKAFGAAASPALLLIACSPMEPPTPRTIEMVLGDEQVGEVGEALPLPFTVRVIDQRDVALEGATVAFTVTAGDGYFDTGSPPLCGPLFPAHEARTNADGYAWASFTPLSFGPVEVEATVSGLDGQQWTFTLDASDAGASVTKLSGDNQTVETSVNIPDAFAARVTNGQGDPMAGVVMVWEVTAGEGVLWGPLNYPCGNNPDLDTLPHSVSRTVRTLSDGTAGGPLDGVRFYPRIADTSTVSVSVDGVENSPLTFTVDALEASVRRIRLNLDRTGFQPADESVPVGTIVVWSHYNATAHIVSTSAPAGGASFDSGTFGPNDTFKFVFDAVGTWEYVDQISGAQGTVTAY